MTPLRIHCFQHLRFEGLASIGEWAQAHGHQVSFSYFYDDAPQWPALQDFDWLVVMGGTMGAYEEDQFPWLKQEKLLIRQAIDAGKVVLGICLGAQLIASATGAQVYPGPQKEIGWWPVRTSDAAAKHPLFKDIPQEMITFHWHGDTFDLPEGAVRLASSKACLNQAFAIGERVLGLQFHFEVTPDAIRQMLIGDNIELLDPSEYVQTPATILAAAAHADANTQVMAGLLDKFEAIARRG